MKTLSEKTRLIYKSIYNMRLKVKAVIDEVVGKKEKVNPSEVPGEKVNEKVNPSKSDEVRVTGEGALVVNDIDASIYKTKVPQRTSPTSSTSSTSAHLTSSPDTSSKTSSEKKPPVGNGEPPAKKPDYVMHPIG